MPLVMSRPSNSTAHPSPARGPSRPRAPTGALAALALASITTGASAAPLRLSTTDRHASTAISPDGLGVTFSVTNAWRSVRGTNAIQPGSGVWYVEGRRHVGRDYLGFAVGSASMALDVQPGLTDQSVLFNAQNNTVTYNNRWNGATTGNAEIYGLVVDYRGDRPVVAVLTSTAPNVRAATMIARVRMSNVTGPVYLMVSGMARTAAVQQSINAGQSAFWYDPVDAMNRGVYLGGRAVTPRWFDPTATVPTLTRPRGQTILLGETVTFSATANDAEEGSLSHLITWRDTASGITGTGSTFSFTPSTLGASTIQLSVTDAYGDVTRQTASLVVDALPTDDSDLDGLSIAAERAAGADPNDVDTDDDELPDGAEVTLHLTRPDLVDTDADGLPDLWELRRGTNARVADASADPDADGATNAAEYAADTRPLDPASLPGRGRVVWSASDRAGSATGTGTALTVSGAGLGAARSDVAIAPASGMHYAEVTVAGGARTPTVENLGFGVASASASLADPDAGDQALTVRFDGTIRYAGATVATVANPEIVTTWGLAVDYAAATPTAYVLVNCVPRPLPGAFGLDGQSCFDNPAGHAGLPVMIAARVPLPTINTAVHLLGFATAPSAATLTLNAGENVRSAPFRYPANYVLVGEGYPQAETMGLGWGPARRFTTRPGVDQVEHVRLVRDAGTNWGVTLSDDGLGVSFSVYSKSMVRANQGMIGEFRYFETTRYATLASIQNTPSIGQGLATAYTQADPYCFEPEQPSYAYNSVGSFWHRLNWVANAPSANVATIGFAVDYRGARPIVYAIQNGAVVHTMTLNDVFVPVYPMLYGHSVGGPIEVFRANFGASPFVNDARAALSAAGVNVGGFVPGWGDANRTTPNAPPTITLTPSATTVNVGQAFTVTAAATDAEDGNLASAVQWNTDVGASGSGATFSLTRTTAGPVLVTGRVVDSRGAAAVASVTINVVVAPPSDLDGDGLTDAEEAALGSNPNSTDSDGDGLGDFVEVRTHGTSPTSSDTDADQLPDAWELQYGLDPRVFSRDADPDGDGYSNLAEFQANTQPNNGQDWPGRPQPTVLSATDKTASAVLAADALGVTWGTSAMSGARSTVAINPGTGIFYYEGSRLVGTGDYGFGVSTAAAPLDNFGGATDQSVGVSSSGAVYYAGTSRGSFTATANGTYGLAVDYRGANPIVHVILAATAGAQPAVFRSLTMTGVTAPLYIHVYGRRTTGGVQQRINAGADLVAAPFTYDVRALLAAANVTGAPYTYRGWAALQVNRLPTVTITSGGGVTVEDGANVSFTATALDAEDGALTSALTWRESGSPATALGSSFTFTARGTGAHTVTAQVVDARGGLGSASVTITVASNVDTDGDGVSDFREGQLGTNPNVADTDTDQLDDGAELTWQTNPLVPDTDGDGLPDGWEVRNGLVPTVVDGSADPDGDGFTNVTEYAAGSDPNDSASYPPQVARLSATDRAATITLDAARLGVTFGENAQRGVRSDTAIQPGSGFFYFEGERLTFSGDYGFAVATAAASLDAAAGNNAQSLAASALGNVRFNNATVATFQRFNNFYGFAVDYRGANPIVHVIAAPVQNGPGALISSTTMTGVTGPVYILVYGLRVSATLQQRVNTGLDLTATPFRYDARGILTAAGRAGSALTLRWEGVPPGANRRATVTASGPTSALGVGQPVTLSATATDPEDGDLTANITWRDAAGAALGSGPTYTFTTANVGEFTYRAEVRDSRGSPASASVTVRVVDPASADDDRDGLTNGREATLGTNPALADTDGDTLSDGNEVDVRGTNALAADTDGDAMNDGVEVQWGFDPLVADASADRDGDGFSNLAELTAGTSPTDANDYPGRPRFAILSSTDRHSSLVLSADQLSVSMTEAAQRGVRSDLSIAPGSGFYYFEGDRQTYAGDYGFGLATAAHPLDLAGGANTLSMSVNTGGFVAYNGRSAGTFQRFNYIYGLAVDYRGASPTAYVIASAVQNGPGTLVATLPLPLITQPVFIYVSGTRVATSGTQQRINTGGNLSARPFFFDARAILTAAGVAGADTMTLGWRR